MKKLTLIVDFDGTIVSSQYPRIGTLMSGAKETINKWYGQGHKIGVWTCRAGEHLDNCRRFLQSNGILYHFLNENDPDIIDFYGIDTRKASGDIYFDDKNIGGFPGWQKADEYVQWKSHRKPVVICIVGESGSGKSTLAEYIESNFGVSIIQSYTTRPRRTPDETGHTFVSDAEFDAFNKDDMIAFTEFGGRRYCCLHSDVKEENTYVIDEVGLRYLVEKYSDIYDIKTIRVTCGRDERVKRAGKKRVSRDEGMFVMPKTLFDFTWETDGWRDKSTRREQEYKNLHEFINQSLNRGWN
jgi:guanylate kinase